jgi:hypothetical protein
MHVTPQADTSIDGQPPILSHSSDCAAMLFEDGVYFGLPHAQYLADPAIGSSALKALSYDPAAYWYNSPLNPSYEPPEPTAPQRLGTAFHTMVLDGPEAFQGRYTMEPGPEYLRTATGIADWIKERGGNKLPRAKRDLIARAQEIDPEVKIYDVAVEQAREAGKDILPEEDYTRIVRATEAILANPALRSAIAGGVSEVSVFWTEEVDGVPVRLKSRFDYLKPRAVVDLKSMRPTFGRTFRQECLRAICNWGYYMQADHYLTARAIFAEHARNGRIKVLDGAGVDEEWLSLVCSQTAYAFVFVFWENDGMPLTWGGSLSPGNPILDVARSYIHQALSTFARCSRTFEPGQAWLEYDSLGEIDINDLPAYFGR